ncbi:MAG: hypothetical protein R3B48_03845 [Kofleriaceae bacterium]
MPSFLHEILVELVRNRAALVRELVRACAGPELGEELVGESATVDLSQVVSTEYRADHVTMFYDRRRRLVRAVIIEVQRQVDARKRRTWPVYLTAARANLRCPAALLVLALKPRVARWARQEIDIGHPGFVLRPMVLSLKEVPRVVDAEAARRNPELAVLSVLAHPAVDVAEAAVEGIRGLAEDQFRLYFDVILAALPEAARGILEAHMEGYEYQSDFARKYLALGRQEGRQEGREEGWLRAQQHVALELARSKLALSLEDERAVAGVRDAAALTALIVALGGARDAGEARQVLDDHIPR